MMNAAVSPGVDAVAEHDGIVAELANKFHVPVSEVDATFRGECRRLQKEARLLGYVTVLAARRTRTVLRARTQSPAERA